MADVAEAELEAAEAKLAALNEQIAILESGVHTCKLLLGWLLSATLTTQAVFLDCRHCWRGGDGR